VGRPNSSIRSKGKKIQVWKKGGVRSREGEGRRIGFELGEVILDRYWQKGGTEEPVHQVEGGREGKGKNNHRASKARVKKGKREKREGRTLGGGGREKGPKSIDRTIVGGDWQGGLGVSAGVGRQTNGDVSN